MTKEQYWMLMRVFASIRGVLDARWSFYGRASSYDRAELDQAAADLNHLRQIFNGSKWTLLIAKTEGLPLFRVWDYLQDRKQYAEAMTSELRRLGMPNPKQVCVRTVIREIW